MSGLLALIVAQAIGGELPPASPAPTAPAAVSAEACAGKLYSAFDFWLGSWNVFDKVSGELVGQSKVEKLNNGCLVRESWLPQGGPAGGNFNAPDLITGRWHQYWIAADGRKVDLEGGLYRGEMILTGPWQQDGKMTLLRVTYTKLDGDSLRQRAEVSTDEGLTWQDRHDRLYLRLTPAR